MDVLSENRDLLDGYRRGDRESLEQVYRSYVNVAAAVLRRGFSFSSGGRQLRFAGYHDPDDLRDALQEVFLLALGEAARQGYDGLHPFSGYVTAIARNVVLGRFRRDARRLSHFRPIDGDGEDVLLDDLEPSVIGPALSSVIPAPDEAFETKQVRSVVSEFVAGLDEEQRAILRHRYLDQMSQEQTADQLSLNRNRVRKVSATLKKRLLVQLRRVGLTQHAIGEPQGEEGRS
jgi:RNA polymerase sigma-70 factor (ECF subfamily)